MRLIANLKSNQLRMFRAENCDVGTKEWKEYQSGWALILAVILIS